MAVQAAQVLWASWQELWNGDLARADAIIAPDFVAHFAPLGGSPGVVRGPAGLQGWIGGALGAFADHRFTTEVGPLADGDLMAGRWVFLATYRGGAPRGGTGRARPTGGVRGDRSLPGGGGQNRRILALRRHHAAPPAGRCPPLLRGDRLPAPPPVAGGLRPRRGQGAGGSTPRARRVAPVCP